MILCKKQNECSIKVLTKSNRRSNIINVRYKKEKAEHHSAGTLARLPLIILFIELLFMSVLEYTHNYNTYKLTECQLNSSNSAYFSHI